MLDPQLQPIQKIDLLNLDHEMLEILLKKNVSMQYLLNAARNSNHLIDLLKQVIIQSAREKANCNNSEEQILDWRLKKFGERIEEAFLDKKNDLDAVSFWTLFTKDKGTAIEIFYQLCNQETTFRKLSSLYKGVRKESKRCYCELNSVLRRQLSGAGTEKPQSPIPINSGFLITQVIEQHPAQLNKEMREKLLLELEDEWAKRQLILRYEEVDLLMKHQKN